MRVLIACEESQTVCKAFRDKGHEAYSCDIQTCSGGHPEWHICEDVATVVNGQCSFVTQDGTEHYIDEKWDMIIAHPPCTFLTNGGAVRVFRNVKKEYTGYGTFQMVNVDRIKKMIAARDFFMLFYNSDCDKVVIENPVPMSIAMLPESSQIIQPYEYGEPFSKKTCLWVKGVENLKPTNVLSEYSPFINGGGGRLNRPNYKGKTFQNGSKNRSKFFTGIATAMAEQWG